MPLVLNGDINKKLIIPVNNHPNVDEGYAYTLLLIIFFHYYYMYLTVLSMELSQQVITGWKRDSVPRWGTKCGRIY